LCFSRYINYACWCDKGFKGDIGNIRTALNKMGRRINVGANACMHLYSLYAQPLWIIEFGVLMKAAGAIPGWNRGVESMGKVKKAETVKHACNIRKFQIKFMP
jgi:hypothetical protein